MSKMDLTARSLDMCARGIDLLTALTETTNSPHSFVHVGIELGRWLGREKLSESDLQFCLKKARGLVVANSLGNKFHEAVIAGTRERAVGPLFAQPSGSLGRLMANDPYLCWMTSTVACLFEFHSEDFISDVLCSFIMQTHASHEGKPLNEYQLAWHPLRLQIKPVLGKIVSSIWYNVVNSGVVKSGTIGSNTTLPLPLELQEVCPRGHNLESHKLGVVLNQLQTPMKDVIIESKNLISNLTLWLVYHFKGRLRVTVSGKIVFDRALGPEESTIEHRIQSFCETEGPCGPSDSGGETPKVRIYSSIGGRLKWLSSGRYDTQMTAEQSGRVRQKLYHPVRYPPGAAGKESIRVLARQTAHEIVKWLLNCRLVREEASNELSFKVLGNEKIDDDHNGESLKIADILGRVPSIVNMGWGDIPAAVVVFSVPVTDRKKSSTIASLLEQDDSEMDLDDFDSEPPDDELNEATPEYILQYFPILRDLLEKVRPSCRCYICRSKKFENKLRQGCLQHTAFMEVMAYIAHSVSDAFGAEDCSTVVTQHMEDFGILNILWDLIGGSVIWRTWFDTASRVVLGCAPIQELANNGIDEDYTEKSNFVDAGDLTSTTVALQHGNLAVVAPWLDISQELTLSNCFRFKIVQGRLGILTDNGSNFHGVQGDSAVIETQHTDDVQSYAKKYPLDAEKSGFQVQIQRDVSHVKTDHILVPAGPNRYKLLMRIICDSHSRFLDPARAMIKTSQPIISISCKHQMARKIEVPDSGPILKLYSFEDLLGRWPDAAKGNVADFFNAPRNEGGHQTEAGSDTDDERDFPAGQNHRIPTAKDIAEIAAENTNSTPIFRVSNLLDSCFKYNTALALTYDDPTILNHETACLACILEKGSTFDALNGYENTERNRWVICRIKNPDSGEYGDHKQGTQARKKLRARG